MIMRIIIIFFLFPSIVSGQFKFDNISCTGATYTTNSIYRTNLINVVNSISSDTRVTYGFYNFTSGLAQDPNRVSSLGICRGDVPLGTCQSCIRNAAQTLPQVCNKVDAFGYSQYCTIYVSNGSIYGSVQDSPVFQYFDPNPILSNASEFASSLQGLFGLLVSEAASGGDERKYAAGQTNVTGIGNDKNKIYGLVQCTPDLDASGCLGCLQECLGQLATCCLRSNFKSPGVRITMPSCFVQYKYDESPFFGNVSGTPLPPPPQLMPSTVSRSNHSSTAGRIGISVPIIGIPVLLIVGTIWIVRMRKKRLRKSWMIFNPDEIDNVDSLQYIFPVLKHATEDFKDDNKLGQGGFGTVYKGVLSNGSQIAVKRLSRSSGEEGDVHFKNEILILAKLKHKNLVRLLGFCLHEEEMLLVYELVVNGSLHKFLVDPVRRGYMLWQSRYKIINGIARGILYLHEESRLRIIHCDLKPSNILLDRDFNAKISDFGMARLFDIDQTQTKTSKIVGTLGYMSPEYLLHGQVSVKSDVFSFGILVLEIISGQKISSFTDKENAEDLLSYAWRNWMEGTPWNLVDATLSACFSSDILRCIHIGLLCVQEKPVDRPTMSLITLMLSSSTSVLPVPSAPAFYMEDNPRTNAPMQGNTTNDTLISSVNNVSVSELSPR